MSLVDLRGMPAHLIAAMAQAVQFEPRSITMNAVLDRGSVPADERPIPMKEDGAATMDFAEMQARLEDGTMGASHG